MTRFRRSQKQFLSAFFALLAIQLFPFTNSEARVRRDSQRVMVVVNVPMNTSVKDEIFFTGGADIGCDWNPRCRQFEMIDRPARSLAVRFEVPRGLHRLQFKVTRGDFASEASDPHGRALPNQEIELNGNETIHVMNVITWKDREPLGVTGKVIRIKDVYSPELGNSRDVFVWLPPSYEKNSSRRYPVIYMHDGQNIFDPQTSAFGVDWDIDSAMTHLARQKGIEAIVVGPANLERARMEEYDYTLKGEAYAHFLIDTLKPMIDREFRTLPDRETTFVGGSSMGAHISIALVWKHADVFSKALGFSLPAMVHENSIFKVIRSSPPPRLPFQLYIDHGDWGRDDGFKEPAMRFLELLKEKGVRREQVIYAEFKFHDHTESDWARRVTPPLEWLFAKGLKHSR